ncbi:hypothetical protein QBC46DRAFT_272277 [Diplogelasinospora grovesii]|uniref:Uncharacterized protein n=1 Tax=Diplogelasinospora grovesii TaxID=303347 RepID=A0AAN6MZQ0_9PEZI|nr:hypothetical protein QBC46DRAFT_272277 [Diplogelasinospora grovesii]
MGHTWPEGDRLLSARQGQNDVTRRDPTDAVPKLGVRQFWPFTTKEQKKPGREQQSPQINQAKQASQSNRPSQDGRRVPACSRESAKMHTRRHWEISHDGDNTYNGQHCGQSVMDAVKDHTSCRPMTDWTCVASVTVQFHTPMTCTG